MILSLKIRTEYSFRVAYGHLDRVLALAEPNSIMAIVDRHGTWGHVPFREAARKANVKPVFGVELAVVADAERKERQPENYMGFIARNNTGLRELYELVTEATRNFYYNPRLDYGALPKISDNIAILTGAIPDWIQLPKRKKHLYVSLGPSSLPDAIRRAKKAGLKTVAVGDNFYPMPDDINAYQMTTPRPDSNPWPMHILDEAEWKLIWDDEGAIKRSKRLLKDCSEVDLPTGKMVKYKSKKTLRQMCTAAAKKRGIDLKDKIYKARLDRELKLIKDKKYEDYFYVIADMLAYAKRYMLVGPARGSSCGSLVCYLLAITEIDPIPYDLLFERFIDINRSDLPDIDIDFPDTHRDMVFDYLSDKYGSDCVARLGTVSRFKAKSTIGDVASKLAIPQWEVAELKTAIIERSGGDSRASFCIMDTFAELEIGRKILEKYPQLQIAEQIEGHARHSGQHAAGVLVTAEPVSHFCSIDERTGVAMIDKEDAEKLGLLKIDALGLRTLSILQETLEQIGWPMEKLLRYPTDDQATFDLLNRQEYAGIFQFEGFALQNIAKQVQIESFEDIAALSALARPGPLISGGTQAWVGRRTGKDLITYLHLLTEEMTKVTFGIVVYQEQVIKIARVVGNLSWSDVTNLRKAMSKSLGKEFFNQYLKRFLVGAKKNGLTEDEATEIWEKINTMGSWAFNRSHAVAYGMVSYWCCVLKAHYPLEFAAATLRHAKDEDQSIRVLRELSKAGHEYIALDPERSEANWTVKDGVLLGGLQNIKGVGLKKAQRLIAKRETGTLYTKAEEKLLISSTPYDSIYETELLWGHIKANPSAHGISIRLLDAEKITEHTRGEFNFIGRLKQKIPRDHNELILVQRRSGKKMTGQTKFLNLTFEDDTEVLPANVNRKRFEALGTRVIEEGNIGDWYLLRGFIQNGWRRMNIVNLRKLDLEKDGVVKNTL